MKRSCLLSVFLLSLFFPVFLSAVSLRVYTYDSFSAEWGLGPELEHAFEKECSCDLVFEALSDGAEILTRITFEGKKTKADIALGLDTNLIGMATNTGLFSPHGVDLSSINLPIPWEDDLFVPYDFGWFAFVYDEKRLKHIPRSLTELIESDKVPSIILQDPRVSTPGFAFLLWMKKIYGNEAASAWKKLNSNIVTVTGGWSEAYSLFLKGESDMVLSYTTSPAYHLIAENKTQYKAILFDEGNYFQVEVAGIVKYSQQKDLARKFLSFLISKKIQSSLPLKQWMFPVTEQKLPEGFGKDAIPQKTLFIDASTIERERKNWINEWKESVQ